MKTNSSTMLAATLTLVAFLFATPAHGGRLLLAGGGVDDFNYEIWDKVVELAGGSSARIGVVTAASSTPLDSWNFYGPLFLARGAAETYWIPVHMANQSAAEDPEVVANVRRMTGFFFSGGDQARIIQTFYGDFRQETSVLTAMRERYNEDPAHLMSGTSAGTAVQPTGPMIMGGYSYESLLFGAYDFRDIPIPSGAVLYDQDGGLGFLDNFILDSHFSERGREGRLARLVADTKSLNIGVNYGVGVDENTALLVYDANTAAAYGEVIGENGAVFVDITETTVDESGLYPRITDVIYHYITPGDTIRMTDLVITFGFNKVNLAGNEELLNAPTSRNVYGGEVFLGDTPEFTACAIGLFNCANDITSASTTQETDPAEYTVNFLQTDGRQQAYKDEATGAISYSYLKTTMLVSTGSNSQ